MFNALAILAMTNTEGFFITPVSWMAERVGFEPTERFPVHTLSRRTPSSTRTPLQQTILLFLFFSIYGKVHNCRFRDILSRPGILPQNDIE